MIIKRMPLGFIGTNVYIISDEDKNAVIIDPGFKAEKIAEHITEMGLAPKYILLTHGHFDHVGVVHDLVEKYGCKTAISQKDADRLLDPMKFDSVFAGRMHLKGVKADTLLNDGDAITVGSMTFKFMATPGHTEGSGMFFCENSIFSGDTLFCGCVGRTDFPGGSTETMKKSLKKIKEIDGDYDVYPGHEATTTLMAEKENNPYLKEFNYDIYD